jgi:hypothetical protein
MVLFGGGVSSLHSGIEFGRRRTSEGSSGGRRKGVVWGVGQERLGPSYFFIPLVLGPLNSHVWCEVPLGYIALGWFLFLQEQKKDIIIIFLQPHLTSGLLWWRWREESLGTSKPNVVETKVAHRFGSGRHRWHLRAWWSLAMKGASNKGRLPWHCRLFPLDIEVDPQHSRFGCHKSDFALQRLVECRALETERRLNALRWHSISVTILGPLFQDPPWGRIWTRRFTPHRHVYWRARYTITHCLFIDGPTTRASRLLPARGNAATSCVASTTCPSNCSNSPSVLRSLFVPA